MHLKHVVLLIGALFLTSGVPAFAEPKSVLNQTFEEWQREHYPEKDQPNPYGGLVCAGVVFVLFFGGMFLFFCGRDKERARQKNDAERRRLGDPNIICPQCQERGFVTTTPVMEKAGIHGGKATAAILTGGVSMLATGLSNEVGKTQATCSNCGSNWRF